jgi:hypothetical protein
LEERRSNESPVQENAKMPQEIIKNSHEFGSKIPSPNLSDFITSSLLDWIDSCTSPCTSQIIKEKMKYLKNVKMELLDS